MGNLKQDTMPVIRELPDFDRRSGNLLERLVFNHRPLFMLLMALATVVLGYMAVTRLELRPSFEKMIPQSQPYIQNYLENRQSLRGLGNSVRVVVENTQGDIFDPDYLTVLKQVNDELFLMQGVDRAWMKSLWSSAVRWTEVTEQGFQGGPVMPDSYQGSPSDIEQLRQNINRAGIVGSLVASDFKSSMLIVPLLDKTSATGQSINYHEFSRLLEERLRDKIEFASGAVHKAGEEGTGQVQGPGDRFRQADGRPDRWPDSGDDVLRPGGRHLAADHLRLHPLRAQHPVGGRLLADRGGLATGYRRLAGLCHRSVLGAGAVPDLRHRRVPRGAEDERHHAGHRSWHAQIDRRALHLPPSVHRWRHRIAGRRRRLRRADADRYSGDPGPGDHCQHRCRGADLHFAVADAGGAVLHRRRAQGCRACAENRQPRRTTTKASANCGICSTVSPRANGPPGPCWWR